MIATAAVVPHPPLLVPELAGAAAAETTALRVACRDVAARLAMAGDRWVAVGAGPVASHHRSDACGTFAGFGADVRVALGPDADPSAAPDRELALPVLVAGWLRAQAGAAGERVRIEAHVLPADTPPAEARRVGAELAAGEDAVLLVLGDGAATHTPRAPGAFDERAAGWDRAVAAALATGDADVLAGLDAGLADALLAGGRVPWQVLAGAVPRPSSARLEHTSAPFGVAYHVAVWGR
ncbi:hypothetical protein ACQPX6_11100 [Actinomycetospora sp. CA-101289]|uniref:hypothetical protein n=1 Tax=Actinomycetospora sp. CA-101289 TaxID=3239893 RepID=UPI003D954475